jgi:hypothetical protein
MQAIPAEYHAGMMQGSTLAFLARSVVLAIVLSMPPGHAAADQQLPCVDRGPVTSECAHEAVSSIASAEDKAALTFEFRSGFWINLHHFLYVLGRAANGEADASREAVARAPQDLDGFERLGSEEQRIWRDAVAFYQNGPSRRDAIFNDTLTGATAVLARAADRSTLDGLSLDDGLIQTLLGAAPIYRQVWWARHRASCEARVTDVRRLLSAHGEGIANRIAAAWQEAWPQTPVTIDMTAYANWAGAYSTDRHGGLIVFSCLNEGNAGLYGVEILFHEAMHWWDDATQRRLSRIARDDNVTAPPDLSHALIFYTAGHSVQAQVEEHVPYAERFGIWQRGLARFKPALDAHWAPWLRGETGNAEAIRSLLRALASGPP